MPSLRRILPLVAVAMLSLASFVAGYATGHAQAAADCQRERMRVSDQHAAQLNELLRKLDAAQRGE